MADHAATFEWRGTIGEPLVVAEAMRVRAGLHLVFTPRAIARLVDVLVADSRALRTAARNAERDRGFAKWSRGAMKRARAEVWNSQREAADQRRPQRPQRRAVSGLAAAVAAIAASVPRSRA